MEHRESVAQGNKEVRTNHTKANYLQIALAKVECVRTVQMLQSVFLFFSFLKIFIGEQLIYNVVLVSAVQQSESVIHIPISTLFQILFPYRSLQSIEQSSLCYTVGPYQSSILYIVVYICQSQSPNLSLPPKTILKKIFIQIY